MPLSTCVTLLKYHLVSSIPPPPQLVVVSSTETPVQGFEKLLKYNILAAPVYDEVAKKYTGFLDIRDLISYAVFAFENRDKVAYKPKGPVYTTLIDDVTVTYFSRRNPFHPVNSQATLWDVAQILAKGGVHRVPVVDSDGKLLNIVSQSTLIQLFNRELNASLKEVALLKILGSLGTSPVLSVSADALAIDAFKLMDNSKRTGIAVVDSQLRLVGNTSGKDLKLFIGSTNSYDVLMLPILTFLNKIREEKIDISMPSIAALTDDTLGYVIQKLASTRVHRLYIVNSDTDYRPIRVISLTDILRYIIHITNDPPTTNAQRPS